MDPRMKKLGYRLVYVPHRTIGNHIACYNVMYRGKHIYPKVALAKLRMPLNEIWVSRKYKSHLDAILYHELQEIGYRARGYSEKRAHTLAVKDTEKYEAKCKLPKK